MTPEACILCGSGRADALFAYDRPDVYETTVGVTSQGYARAWVRCHGCDFHYSRHTREGGALDRIYDDAYRDARRAFRGGDVESTFRRMIELPPEQSECVRRAETLRRTIERLQDQAIVPAWGDPPYRLLDVGGASGVFAYVFRSVFPDRFDGTKGSFGPADWRCEIVDPGRQGRFIEAHGIRYHMQRFGRPTALEEADSDLVRAEDGSVARFELITLNYLLEHVPDPLEVLRSAVMQLADAGLIYVEVPDALAFRHLPPEDDIFNSCHLWMFDPSALTRLLGRADLEVLTLDRARSPRGHLTLSALARPR